ncbi:MAG: glycosyl hydrolase family 28-related protein [bacterium]
MKFTFIAILLSLLAIFSITGFAAKNSALLPSEEFNGPFASWKNLKTDFKAVGDGVADDTAAFKAGLESLAEHGKGKPGAPYVLYLPAGIYRITAPLVWRNRIDVALLGEDPAKTIVRYDGPVGEAILTLHGVSYSKFGRITWDGQGKARAAVAHQWNPEDKENGGPPGTYMEHADEVFQDVGRGIIGGAVVAHLGADGKITNYNHGMDAETLVKRCKFIRCSEAGLSIESFNALDWWVWDSEFIDCNVGATNCATGEYGGGHFHLYRNVFRGSKVADIRTGHCSYFGIRFNTSIGSRRFLETIRPEGYGKDNYWGKWQPEDTYGAVHSLQGNRILNPLDSTPIFVNQHGPLLLLDNTFVVKPAGDKPVVQVTPPTDGAQCISIGNRFFGASRIEVKGDLTVQDDETFDYAKADLTAPYLPPTAPRTERHVFDLKVGATGVEIQAAIDEAVKLVGQQPVVHLPAGRYPVAATLNIPAGSDLQLIGDGQQTTLVWEGVNEGTMLHIAGPARATLRDFRIAGIWNSKGQILGRGIVAENLDQRNGQILLDQACACDCTRLGMLFDGLTQTRVEAQGGGPGGNTGPGLTVIGGGDKTTAWMGFFGGSGSNNQQTHVVKHGGKLVVWDTWYETAVSTKDAEPRYIHLTDRGNLTFFNGTIATLPGKEARRDLASVDLDGFVGRFTLIGAGFNTMNPQIRLAGTGEGMKALVLATGFGATNPYLDNQAKVAEVAVLACRQNNKNLSTIGKPSPEFLREMLKDARTVLPTRWQPAPAGATDLRLYRVTVYIKVGEGMVFSADKTTDKKD